MDVATFRRYLQPSPTLRWHPWAPLATLVLGFTFVFGLGVAFGIRYEQRELRPSQYSAAIFDVMTHQEAKTRPTALLIRRAQRIDNAVAQVVYEDEHKTLTDRAIDALQPYFRHERMRAMDVDKALHDSVRQLAEWRLANLSAGAPAWEQTSAYCAEWNAKWDFYSRYERDAKAYTALLGRKVTAQQLAPAVPGGKCN